MSGTAAAAEAAFLVQRILSGDGSAEDELVRRFSERVYIMARCRTLDDESAREMRQDVFLDVLQSLRNGCLRDPSKLAAFVHSTTSHKISNHLRDLWRRPRGEPLEGLAENHGTKAECPELLALARKAVDQLDPYDREILLLTVVDGWKPGEIARQLDATSQTVRARKSRALRRLRQVFGTSPMLPKTLQKTEP